VVIVQENGTMSCHIGRLTVAYLPQDGVIRVIETRTGVPIREDPAENMDRKGFKKVVEHYQAIATI